MKYKEKLSITIQPIILDNWKKAISLDVAEGQKEFVASNLQSMAESQFYETAHNYGIYQEQEMIGCIFIFIPPDDPELGHIVRFMIDKNHQKRDWENEAF